VSDPTPIEEPTAEQPVLDEPPPRLWRRFLAASLVVFIAMAAATALTALHYLNAVAKSEVHVRAHRVEPGAPQTILILGSDKRARIHTQGLSDTTMLLRVDPAQKAIRLLSLPRDLKVSIPGAGVGKLNEAYTLGGPKLTTQVVHDLTGLTINHVVNVDFTGFARAVNAIGCVYVDVDRHYFNPTGGNYSAIDIPAGYQRLCGYQALQYVRYRHTDNDIVRAARQQDFLRDARAKVAPAKLFGERDKLIKIFTDYTSSNFGNLSDVIGIFKTLLFLRSAPIQQVHFPAQLGRSYVTASQRRVDAAVRELMGLAQPGARAPAARKPSGGGKGKRRRAPAAPVPLIDATGAAQPFVAATEKRDTLPIYYPTKLAPSSVYDDQSRPAYKILNPDGSFKYQAYKYVFSRPSPSVVTEYYGFQGTSWTDPPILDDPDQTKSVGNRDYLQFFDADRLRLVGWKTSKGSYWVSNTLGETLSTPQMMAIAQSVRLANPPPSPKAKPKRGKKGK
jgi:polyisoprenyl-teichoic acid--peptidoglycan teichoic acid transferase